MPGQDGSRKVEQRAEQGRDELVYGIVLPRYGHEIATHDIHQRRSRGDAVVALKNDVGIRPVQEKEAALKVMMPEADTVAKLGDWEPHEKHAEYYAAQKCGEVKITSVKDEKTGEMKEEKECLNPQDIGYIVEGFGKGYSSYIHILASVDKNFVLN